MKLTGKEGLLMHTKPTFIRHLPILWALSVLLLSIRASHCEPTNAGNAALTDHKVSPELKLDYKESPEIKYQGDYKQLGKLTGDDKHADDKYADDKINGGATEHKGTTSNGFIWFEKGQSNTGNLASPDHKVSPEIKIEGLSDHKIDPDIKYGSDLKLDYKESKYAGEYKEFSKELGNNKDLGTNNESIEFKAQGPHKGLGHNNELIELKTQGTYKGLGNPTADDKYYSKIDDKFNTTSDDKYADDKSSGGGVEHKGTSSNAFIWFDKSQANQGNTTSDIKSSPALKLDGLSKEAGRDIPLDTGDTADFKTHGHDAALSNPGVVQSNTTKIFGTGGQPAGDGKLFNPSELKFMSPGGSQFGGLTNQAGKSNKTNNPNTTKFNQLNLHQTK